MSLREQLRRRADVPNEEIDDVIERAAALQDEDRRAAEGASIEEVERVAAELDIDPSYVEEALNQLQKEKEAEKLRAELEAAREEAQRGRSKRFAMIGLAGLLAVGAGFGGLGVVGANQLSASATQVEQSEVALHAVLDRQAALLPQLVALTGAERLDTSALDQAEDVDARLQASRELSITAAELLAEAPPATSEADAQTRLNLQYELTGTQNRITTEQRRYEEAKSAYDAAADGLAPSIAIALGMAP